MLYHLHELRKAALTPTNMWSRAASVFYDAFGESLGATPYGRFLIATNEMVERSTKIFDQPEWGFHDIKRGQTTLHLEHEVIMETPFCTLSRFNRYKKGKPYGLHDPKVLMVAPMSGHYATLLRDTVRAMSAWHEVYITEWKNVRDIPLDYGDFTQATYVEHLLEFMKLLGREHHIVAVCQPSVPVLAAVSILAEQNADYQPRSMTLMGGPIDTRINPGKVNKFVHDHSMSWFRRNLITRVPHYYLGAGRQVCPGFVLLTGFMSLNPDRHSEASIKMFEHLIRGDQENVESHRRFYDEYRAVMDLSASYYLESIQGSFKDHQLPRGLYKFHGHRIHPGAIEKTALLTIEGELDDISCPGQTFAAHELCSNLPTTMKSHYFQEGVGHYGIFNGRRWRNNIQPQIAKFIENHSK